MSLHLETLDVEDTAPVLPDSFLGGSAPHLRRLWLAGIPYPFPGLRRLPLSAPNLVFLSLRRIPHSDSNPLDRALPGQADIPRALSSPLSFN